MGENSRAPDFEKAEAATGRIFDLLDRKRVIDNLSEEGKKNNTDDFNTLCFNNTGGNKQ